MLCGFWPIQPRDLSVARRGVDQVDANPGCAAKSQHLCCCIGQIDDPACDHWTPVIDAHDDRSVIMQVGHANQSAQRKAAVGARHSIHVEGFTARGRLALESVAIPGRTAKLKPPVKVRVLAGMRGVQSSRAMFCSSRASQAQHRDCNKRIAKTTLGLACDKVHAPPSDNCMNAQQAGQPVLP